MADDRWQMTDLQDAFFCHPPTIICHPSVFQIFQIKALPLSGYHDQDSVVLSKLVILRPGTGQSGFDMVAFSLLLKPGSMKKIVRSAALFVSGIFLLNLVSCNGKDNVPSKETLTAINLKRGDIVSCGPPDSRFGTVVFETSCSGKKDDFNLAMSLLHSFEYDEAEKVFAKIIDEEPGCAMAYWGVAMSNYHMVWPTQPTQAELEKGAKAIAIAQSLPGKSKRESDFIDAIALFYKDWNRADHSTRRQRFGDAMEKIYEENPDDKESGIFYALTLIASANPADKTFRNQKKAAAILNGLYPGQPDHPGIVHYIIHTYDYPELASLALEAARKYAFIAPSSAHAQHMPSHIFTRLGLWDECIQSNLAAASSAKCYAEQAGIKGHWDEELHALDYLVYGYLQKGDNVRAKEQYDYLTTINEVHPANFKVAYAYAAIPARYVLENKMWKEAAVLPMYPASFAWNEFPWQEAIIHFTRVLGNVHTGKIDSARSALKKLQAMHDKLLELKDSYKANQVLIQVKTAEAWIRFKEGEKDMALKLMNEAAVMEDNTEKSSVTPGEVIPARELLGDMLLQMDQPVKALEAYKADLVKHPNRFNGLYGAGLAAEKSRQPGEAKTYYRQLINIANSANSGRIELTRTKSFLKMDS
jgi:tetratricopeptide (TPR) repeat protein